MANLNTLERTGKRAYRRVGRGQGSTRGKQSGRGGKGQTARAGHKIRPEWRDIIKKLPKRRGYGKNRSHTVNSARANAVPVGIELLEAAFKAGSEVNPQTLVAAGVISMRSKRAPLVKILGNGELTKKLTVTNCLVSVGAKAAIEKAGGTVTAPVSRVVVKNAPKTRAIKAL